jgi:hypothetical protein
MRTFISRIVGVLAFLMGWALVVGGAGILTVELARQGANEWVKTTVEILAVPSLVYGVVATALGRARLLPLFLAIGLTLLAYLGIMISSNDLARRARVSGRWTSGASAVALVDAARHLGTPAALPTPCRPIRGAAPAGIGSPFDVEGVTRPRTVTGPRT